MRNSWLKLCKYINCSWFPSRKHTQVLRFFQSHDHMIYSEQERLCADLVWKSALLHKCENLEDLHQRLMPEKGDRWETTCQYMWSHATTWHSTIPSVVRAWLEAHSRMASLLPCPLLPFPQPHWGVFLSLEMEGFWALSTWTNVLPGSNGCCMQRHHSWTISGRIRHTKIVPKSPCQRRYQVWCGWEPGRLNNYFF